MTKMRTLLDERMKKPANTSKMAAMAKQSAEGQLTSFSGLFSVSELSEKEKETLKALLAKYAAEEQNIENDAALLFSLTSEVKAINNQAALLHGERIKKAHDILVHYREGAFTAWLINTYGNRQTPYNLMQYYEFCEAMPKTLRPTIETMPRQAVYVLATREGELSKKQEVVEKYKGETKNEMLLLIRSLFPLQEKDRRSQLQGKSFLNELKRLKEKLNPSCAFLTLSQSREALLLLEEMKKQIEKERA